MHTGPNVLHNAANALSLSRHTIDPATLGALTVDELEELLRRVRAQLGVERLQQITNHNTASVRLPLDICDQVKALALRFKTTRSRILRQAVLEFVARHTR